MTANWSGKAVPYDWYAWTSVPNWKMAKASSVKLIISKINRSGVITVGLRPSYQETVKGHGKLIIKKMKYKVYWCKIYPEAYSTA